MVVDFVPGRVDQRHWAFAGTAVEVPKGFGMPGELQAVAAAELIPALRIMSEPPAQIRSWRDFLDPLVQLGLGLAKTARPQAIDEDSSAVCRFGRVICALEPEVRCSALAIDDSGDLR